MKTALYDLKLIDCPTTYDYFVWLTQIRVMGYEHVVYDTTEFRHIKHPGGLAEAKARFENFIWPSTQFAGMGRSLGNQADRVGNCSIPDLIKLNADSGRDIPRLKSILPPAKVKYTVTLRQMAFKPGRNSNLEVWKAFARWIGAHVIEDHFVQPISMAERMSLYAGAEMNFGIMGGPMALLLWTPYAFRTVCPPSSPYLTRSMGSHGMHVGKQWPFQLSNQKLVWEEQTLDNLMRMFEECDDARGVNSIRR